MAVSGITASAASVSDKVAVIVTVEPAGTGLGDADNDTVGRSDTVTATPATVRLAG